jgi:hypothetical protein
MNPKKKGRGPERVAPRIVVTAGPELIVIAHPEAGLPGSGCSHQLLPQERYRRGHCPGSPPVGGHCPRHQGQRGRPGEAGEDPLCLR